MCAYSAAAVEMLISVCRRSLGTYSTADLLPLENRDWRGVIAAARDHGLIGPVQSGLLTLAGTADDIRETIRTAVTAQVAQNLRLVYALIEICRGFRSRDIRYAVLKGPAVAILTSGRVGAREFTDLDVLVRSCDLHRARVLLTALGYTQLGNCIENVRRPGKRKDIAFFRESDGFIVELHWALTLPQMRFPFEATGIWNRLQTIHIQNDPIDTLGLEDTITALCIHGSVHGWQSLKWTYDIAQFVHNDFDAVDWRGLMSRSRTGGYNRALLTGIQLASLLFTVQIPELLNTLAPEAVSTSKLAERFRDVLSRNEPLSGVELITSMIQIHDRLWDRITLAAHVVTKRLRPTPADPITAAPIRLLSRIVRLLRSYGLGWLRAALVTR
jgi:hypothetical protein